MFPDILEEGSAGVRPWLEGSPESPSVLPVQQGVSFYLIQASQVLCGRHWSLPLGSLPLGSSLDIFKKLKKKKKE